MAAPLSGVLLPTKVLLLTVLEPPETYTAPPLLGVALLAKVLLPTEAMPPALYKAPPGPKVVEFAVNVLSRSVRTPVAALNTAPAYAATLPENTIPVRVSVPLLLMAPPMTAAAVDVIVSPAMAAVAPLWMTIVVSPAMRWRESTLAPGP